MCIGTNCTKIPFGFERFGVQTRDEKALAKIVGEELEEGIEWEILYIIILRFQETAMIDKMERGMKRKRRKKR